MELENIEEQLTNVHELFSNSNYKLAAYKLKEDTKIENDKLIKNIETYHTKLKWTKSILTTYQSNIDKLEVINKHGFNNTDTQNDLRYTLSEETLTVYQKAYIDVSVETETITIEVLDIDGGNIGFEGGFLPISFLQGIFPNGLPAIATAAVMGILMNAIFLIFKPSTES